MNEKLYNLHLESGRIAGRDKTCGKKNAFETEEAAQKASDAHNRWEKRHHDVEPYPCAFCEKWHIGGVMSVELLESIVLWRP